MRARLAPMPAALPLRAAVVAGAIAAAGAAAAQTRGIVIPGASLVGDDDPTAAETNPAALGFSRTGLVLMGGRFGEASRLGASGAAGFLNLSLGSLSSALGVQVLGESLERREAERLALASRTKLTWGLALRGGRTFGLGVGLHWFGSDDSALLDPLFSADVGMTLRPWRYLALASVVRDANTPAFGLTHLQRVYENELALRPLGHDAIEVAGGLDAGEDSGEVAWRARVSAALMRGVRLRADLRAPRADADGDGHLERDLRATAGLAIDVDRFGTFGGAAFSLGTPGDVAPGGDGAGWVAGVQVGEEHYRPAPLLPGRFEDIVLGDPLDERDWLALLAHLRRAERDPDLRGVVLRPQGIAAGYARIEELRERMRRLRAAGKAVYVHLAEADTRETLLATAADRVLCDPVGGLRLTGLRVERWYFKGTLDKIGVRGHVLKIGEYKSAPEAVTDAGPSEPARQQTDAVLDDAYALLVGELAASRRLTRERAAQIVDGGPYTAREAREVGLVDDLVHVEDLEEWLERRHGLLRIEQPWPPDTVRPRHWAHLPRIAVIVVEGDIVDGESRYLPLLDRWLTGADTVAQAIHDAAEDLTVRAIVLRVDSPGGSATASDRIWREAMKARAHKPVIASMGDVAASGGYYVAAAADRIVAPRSTVTGSIGIFFGKLDLSGLLGRLGVTWASFERGKRAGIDAVTRDYTDAERQALTDKLRQFYDRFLEVIEKGRGLARAEADAVGRGRVWSGERARTVKLVDATGTFDDALEEAMRRAGLDPSDPVELEVLPDLPDSLAERFARSLMGEQPEASLRALVPAALRDGLSALPASLLDSPDAAQARMDERIVIR